MSGLVYLTKLSPTKQCREYQGLSCLFPQGLINLILLSSSWFVNTRKPVSQNFTLQKNLDWSKVCGLLFKLNWTIDNLLFNHYIFSIRLCKPSNCIYWIEQHLKYEIWKVYEISLQLYTFKNYKICFVYFYFVLMLSRCMISRISKICRISMISKVFR